MAEPTPQLSRFNVTFDAALELHSKAAAATSATTVTGDKGILDLGGAVWMGWMVVDVQSLTVAATHAYTIVLQGSNSATFASGAGLYTRELCVLRLGDAASFTEDVDSVVGRYKRPCWNLHGAELCRYVRLRIIAAVGAIDLNAFLAKGC
jgi:hypothetical protein